MRNCITFRKAQARVPRCTLEELAHPAPNGQRHGQMLATVKVLLGNGWSPDDAFAQYRNMYAKDLPDGEIWGIINWAVDTNPEPSGWGENAARPAYQKQKIEPAQKAKRVSPAEAIANARGWLGGFSIDEAELFERSKVALPQDWRNDAGLLLQSLYSADELVCVNSDYKLVEGESKPRIRGEGQTLTVETWVHVFKEYGPASGDAGVWFKLNPLKDQDGSGNNGAHCDEDVAALRFLLIEHDFFPIEIQLSILAKIKLPIAAIYLSGGSSAHALIRLDEADLDTYRARAARIMQKLEFMGFDRSNVNPSRYSRLPGCTRTIGAQGDGRQRLL